MDADRSSLSSLRWPRSPAGRPAPLTTRRDPLPEAFELVEDGHITESDFHDFVFGNAVRLWGTQNPRFFEGTAVAKEAAALLKRGASIPRDAAR